jgi:uncharacterized repeat protein (TIGR03803 family)
MVYRQGAVVLAAAMALAAPAGAASFTTLYSFAAPETGSADANNPYAGLVIDRAGNLYGTTYGGGSAAEGTVYELSPPEAGQGAWRETVLHSFAADSAQDGTKPTGRLLLGPHGALYGTTSAGGAAGGGTVFRLNPPLTGNGAWTETILHAFSGTGGDGALPYAGLAIDSAGRLYGTTSQGGAAQAGAGYGTVFSLSPPARDGLAWTETILHSFAGGFRDGISPNSDLLPGRNGALYGTTPECSGKLGCAGTVFEVRPPAHGGGAWSESVIFGFPTSGVMGSEPYGGLISDMDGALYGTTTVGVGTVFRLSPPNAGNPRWQHNALARFSADTAGGPQGGVRFGKGGALFGTLTYGTRKVQGSVYRLTPAASGPWAQAMLYCFPAIPLGGGVFPVGDLVADAHGNLFGVTEIGGAGGVGTVFELTP